MTEKTRNRIFFGNRLKTCRTFYGYTLQELGERVGATRQYIYQLENGEKTPSSEFTKALADTLNVVPQFFSTDSRLIVSADECNFRKLKSTPIRAAEQALAHGELFRELVFYVEQYVSLPKVNFPNIHQENIEDIENAAEYCRKHWDLTINQPITNMTRVVENAGAIVATFKGISPKIDAFSLNIQRPIIVRSVVKNCATRLRFDIAHECGHLVLHQNDLSNDTDRREDEANRFASAFLLPRRAFAREFPMRRNRLDWQGMFAMKRDWNVSVQAILRRAFDLNVINAAQYRSGNIFISKQGYRKEEPFEPLITEKAELMSLAVEKLHSDFGKRISDVAMDLFTSPELLRALIGVPIQDKNQTGHGVVDITNNLGWATHRWED